MVLSHGRMCEEKRRKVGKQAIEKDSTAGLDNHEFHKGRIEHTGRLVKSLLVLGPH